MFLQNERTIPCPVCQTGIPFDTKQLLRGVRFTCSGCGAGIGLAEESKEAVEKALAAFEEQRDQIAGKKE